MQSSSKNQSLCGISDAFTDEELNALCKRIIKSGILGRSKHYPALLKYIAQCSLSGKTPKEIELAVEVLNRGEDFNVSVDSTVRVYVHQLRKKLDSYYESYEREVAYRIVIPKGQYTIAAQKRNVNNPIASQDADRGFAFTLDTGLLTTAVILLLSLIHI